MAVGECQNCKNLFHLWEVDTDMHKDTGATIYICNKCKHGNYTDRRNDFVIYEEVE